MAVPHVSSGLVKLGSNLCDGAGIGDDHILPVIMNGDHVSQDEFACLLEAIMYDTEHLPGFFIDPIQIWVSGVRVRFIKGVISPVGTNREDGFVSVS